MSVLDINGGVIEVLATAGNNRLGGDDFDDALTDYIIDEFKNQSGLDARRDITALSRIKEAAEKAKIELSSMTQTEINLPFLMQKKDGPVHLEMSVTRAKFNSLTSHLVEATMGPTHQALADAGHYTSKHLESSYGRRFFTDSGGTGRRKKFYRQRAV